jgi:hypothetical protein
MKKEAIGAGTRYVARMIEQQIGTKLTPAQIRTLQRFLGNQQVASADVADQIRMFRKLVESGRLPMGDYAKAPAGILGSRLRSRTGDHAKSMFENVDDHHAIFTDPLMKGNGPLDVVNLRQRSLAAPPTAVRFSRPAVTPEPTVSAPPPPPPPKPKPQPAAPLYGTAEEFAAKRTVNPGHDASMVELIKDYISQRKWKATAATAAGAVGLTLPFATASPAQAGPPVQPAPATPKPSQVNFLTQRAGQLGDSAYQAAKNRLRTLSPGQRDMLMAGTGAAATGLAMGAYQSFGRKQAKYAEDNNVEDAVQAAAGLAGGTAAGIMARHPIDDIRKTIKSYLDAKNPQAYNVKNYTPEFGDIVLNDDMDALTRQHPTWKSTLKDKSFMSGAPGQTHAQMVVEGLDGKPALFTPGYTGPKSTPYYQVPSPRLNAALSYITERIGGSTEDSVLGRWGKSLPKLTLRDAISSPIEMFKRERDVLSRIHHRIGEVNRRADMSKLVTGMRQGSETQAWGRDIARSWLKDPNEATYIYRPKTPLTVDELAKVRANMPNAMGTGIGGGNTYVTWLRNALNLSSKAAPPAVCAGGVCQAMQGVRNTPNPSNALAKDLRFLPDYDLVARSALPKDAPRRILRAGMLGAGARAVVPAAMATGAGLLLNAGLNDSDG